MCVACLNLSTQPCSHRWYQLVRSCTTDSNLANCPEKLKLEGWEARVNDCPFCNGGEHHQTTHRLFGSISSADSVASSPALSVNRRGSGGTLDAAILSPLSRQESVSSQEERRSQRARDMNERIMRYMSSDPHEVLPSARKNYPTYSAAIARTESCSGSSSSNSWSKDDFNPRKQLRSHRSSLSRGWKRMSGRLSLNNSSLFSIT